MPARVIQGPCTVLDVFFRIVLPEVRVFFEKLRESVDMVLHYRGEIVQIIHGAWFRFAANSPRTTEFV